MKTVTNWWAGPLILLLVANSLYWSSLGALDDAVGLGWWQQSQFLVGTGIINLAGVGLGVIGSARWHQGEKLPGAIIFCVGLCVALVTFSYTQGAVEKTFAKNESAATVETAAVQNNQSAVPEAQARVDRAQAALDPLIAAAAIAQSEFERESRSGFGPRATQRKDEWDAALSRIDGAKAALVEAEAALAQARIDATPPPRSDAAIAADTTDAWEIWVRSWVFPALIELLPIMSGWLFIGYARDAREDREALILDKLGSLELRMAERPAPAPRPEAYRPKLNGERSGAADEMWQATAGYEPPADEPETTVSIAEDRREIAPPPRRPRLASVRGDAA